MKHCMACKGLALDLYHKPFLSGDCYTYMKRSRVNSHVECFFSVVASEKGESSSKYFFAKHAGVALVFTHYCSTHFE